MYWGISILSVTLVKSSPNLIKFKVLTKVWRSLWTGFPGLPLWPAWPALSVSASLICPRWLCSSFTTQAFFHLGFVVSHFIQIAVQMSSPTGDLLWPPCLEYDFHYHPVTSQFFIALKGMWQNIYKFIDLLFVSLWNVRSSTQPYFHYIF